MAIEFSDHAFGWRTFSELGFTEAYCTKEEGPDVGAVTPY